MPSDDLLKRMEALTGGPLVNRGGAGRVKSAPLTRLAPSRQITDGSVSSVGLEALLGGSILRPEADLGHLAITRAISSFLKGPDLLSARVRTKLEERRPYRSKSSHPS